jgi:hypothetical protein
MSVKRCFCDIKLLRKPFNDLARGRRHLGHLCRDRASIGGEQFERLVKASCLSVNFSSRSSILQGI